MIDDRAQRVVKQHAMTAKLLGVDFVPAYRSGRGIASIQPEATPAPAAAETPPPAAAAQPANPMPRPSTSPAAPAHATPASPPAASEPTLIEMKPAPTATGPKPTDRAAAQALLDALLDRYNREAPHQHFVTAHTNIVFGDGDPCARLMFVGEAPGEEEDKTGRPFVGRAGQLLNKMIIAMGLRREDVYIANVLKTRPPNNATPTTREAELCAPYLWEQIRIISPEVIVTLGLPSSRLLLASDATMTRLRGNWSRLAAPGLEHIPVMPTYHPAYLLRSYTPENRAKVWSDLQQVLVKLGLPAPSPREA